MPVPFNLSNGPQNDRAKVYAPELADAANFGYMAAAGQVLCSKPCILTALYASIRETLVGTIFLQFYDSTAIVAANNFSSYDTCSEPLTVPGGTFIWEPQGATSAQYQYPETRTSVRGPKRFKGECVPTGFQISEIRGLTFDRGLFVVASTAKTGLALAAANLVRVTAWLRYPSEQGNGIG